MRNESDRNKSDHDDYDARVRSSADTASLAAVLVHITYIREKIDEQKVQFEQFKGTLDTLQKHGCEMGRANRVEIARIQAEAEKRGGNAGMIGGGAVGVVVAIVAGFLEWMSKKGG